LLPLRDLIFELIAIGQEKYIEDISYWETPVGQRIISTAGSQARELMRVFEKISDRRMLDSEGREPAQLLRVNFVFDDSTIKIDHPYLAGEIPKLIQRYYDGLPYRNWHKELERYPDRFSESLQKQEFKYRFARSLYNLLTQVGVLELEPGIPFPNTLMEFIAQVLEFSLVPVGKKRDNLTDKGKLIRLWVQRHEVEEQITFTPIVPDRERLLKYFDRHFIDLTGDTKRADAISIAGFLAIRFDLQHLLPDLAHLAQILKESNFLWKEIEGDPHKKPFTGEQGWNSLLAAAKGRSIAEVTIRLEGEDHASPPITERLPLHLLEKAIQTYYHDHTIDFEHDIIPTTVTGNLSGYHIDKGDHINTPDSRFIVQFVDRLYRYLLTEAPPGQYDSSPSRRYYAIIANLLQLSQSFGHNRDTEDFLVEKVRAWHNLSTPKE
jgi:hypothetical protein